MIKKIVFIMLMLLPTLTYSKIVKQELYQYYDYTSYSVNTTSNIISLNTTGWMEYSGVFSYYDTPISIEKSGIRARIKVSDWSQLDEFSLMFSSSGTDFNNTYEIDLSWHIQSPTNNQWINVVIPFSELYKYGSPNASQINSFMWRLRDRGGSRISAQISNLEIIPSTGTNPIVSITIDDGNETIMDALQLSQSYNIDTSIYIDENVFNTSPFISTTEFNQINSSNWEIGGHSVKYNLKTVSATKLSSIISATKNYLTSNTTKGNSVFAYPNGIHNDRVANVVKSNYSAMLNIDGMNNILPVVDRTNINRISVDKWTPVGLIEKWIDNAIANNEWLILNFHSFYPETTTDENYPLIQYEQVLQYLQDNNVKVEPVGKILATMPAPLANTYKTILRFY